MSKILGSEHETRAGVRRVLEQLLKDSHEDRTGIDNLLLDKATIELCGEPATGFHESAMVFYRNEQDMDDGYDSSIEIVDVTHGSPGNVTFDWERIWKFIKKYRVPECDFSYRDLHYVHVHPTGFGPQYSEKDLNCVLGQLQSFGFKNVLDDAGFPFWIIAFANDKPFDYNGDAVLYYPSVQDNKLTLRMEWRGLITARLPRNVAEILKILSYRGPYA